MPSWTDQRVAALSPECVPPMHSHQQIASPESLKSRTVRLIQSISWWLLFMSRWRSIRFVHQRQRLTFDQPQQLRCQISGQLTLSRSCECCHVLQPSTVISTQYRPGSLSVLRWCLLPSSVWFVMHHCDPECFLIYANLPLYSRSWRSHHSTLTIWILKDWYWTSVLFWNLWKESLLAD